VGRADRRAGDCTRRGGEVTMGQLSAVLRDSTDGGLMFWCPGCNVAHGIKHGVVNGPRWGWNGSADKPTFTPSILVKSSDFTPAGRTAYEAWCAAGDPVSDAQQFERAATICHSFVTDGRIQFLGDCTHALAGTTVDLPPWASATDGF
jgi:hypothetical protein